MKAECVKDKLKTAVLKAEKLTGKHLSLPILNSILIKCTQKSIVLTATNLDVGIEIEVPAKVDREGTAAVNGSLLGNFLSIIPDNQTIRLEEVGGNLCISGDKNSTIIKGFPVDEFPTIPRVTDGESVLVPANKLVYGIKSVCFASSVSDIKPEIASVYMYSDHDDVVFVATDSFRLAEKKIDMGKDCTSMPPLLIPFKNAIEVVRIFENIDDNAEVVFNKNQISFSVPSVYFTSRLVGGIFPNYKQIMPSSKSTDAVIEKKDFINALKLTALFSDKLNQIMIKVITADKIFEVESRNQETGENTTKIDAEIDGEDAQLSFNAKYIMDSFQSIPEDRIHVSFAGHGKPMVIRGVGSATFTYLVMPMNK